MNLLNFIKEINTNSKEIIYFGGSFNPWHEGHSECLRKVPKDAIKIVIPDHNPLKKVTNRSIGIDENYLCSLNDNVYIYKGFFEKKVINPTVDWLPKITKDLKEYSHSILIGYDSYLSLTKWKNYRLLLSYLSKLYVLNRKNESIDHLYEVETIFLGSHLYESLSSSSLRKKDQ